MVFHAALLNITTLGLLMNESNTQQTSPLTENTIVYQAHLHWIIFVWPVLLLCGTVYVAIVFEQLRIPAYVFSCCALLWGLLTGLTYLSSYLIIKNKQVVLCTGILVRQTIDISMNKIESVDIRQSILGSIFNYGALMVTGTGGSRQLINYLDKPLTCRRYIEQLMHG